MRVYAPRKRVAVVCRDGVVPTQEDACTIPCELNSMKPVAEEIVSGSAEVVCAVPRRDGHVGQIPTCQRETRCPRPLPTCKRGVTYTELALYRQLLQENPGNVELLAARFRK